MVTPESLDVVFNLVEVKANVAENHYYHRRGVCTGWIEDISQPLQREEQPEKKIQVRKVKKIPQKPNKHS